MNEKKLAEIVVFSEDPLSSDALKFSLESKGFSVYSYNDLRKGLKHIVLKQPDIIIIDEILSGPKPGDIVSGIRKKLKDFTAPFLFILNPPLKGQNINGFNPSLDGYIERPYSLDRIIETTFILLRIDQRSDYSNKKQSVTKKGKKNIHYDPELMSFVEIEPDETTQPSIRPEKMLSLDPNDKVNKGKNTGWLDELSPLDENISREHISLIGDEEVVNQIETPPVQKTDSVPTFQTSEQRYRGTILVIDDERFIIRILKTILEAEHYRVLTADNGLEGLKRCKDIIPDLILLDIMMPELDGYEFTEIIRLEPGFEDIPIIMLSARSLTQDKGQAFKLGANFYMQKPVDREKLLGVIENLISNKE